MEFGCHKSCTVVLGINHFGWRLITRLRSCGWRTRKSSQPLVEIDGPRNSVGAEPKWTRQDRRSCSAALELAGSLTAHRSSSKIDQAEREIQECLSVRLITPRIVIGLARMHL